VVANEPRQSTMHRVEVGRAIAVVRGQNAAMVGANGEIQCRERSLATEAFQ
jgi:hypothetical protein